MKQTGMKQDLTLDKKADKDSVMSRDDLVTIGGDKALANPSRRNFLKVLGATSAAGLAACADNASQKIFPNVHGNEQQVPGVSVWYNSTCTDCSAGCGISVRTREGRAVKIEGNSNHPVNRGGLCALGHSSLQSLYDPDRVRQPLKRSGSVRGRPTFAPISWNEALGSVTEWIKKSKKNVVLTGATSGALDELLTDFAAKNSAEKVSYELFNPVSVAEASERVFGVRGIPAYRIDKAKTVVNFGSDFLETWVSPCEYARDWSIAKKRDIPLRLVHIEPRLSLTGGSADLWLSPNPGTEIRIALAILKIVSERGRREVVNEQVRAKLAQILSGVSVISAAEESGVAADKIALTAEYLLEEGPALVLAGGVGASSEQEVALMVVCNYINLFLGSVGTTIDLSKTRPVQSPLSKLRGVIDSLNSGEIDILFVHGTNPVFTLPSANGFEYAAKKAGHVVSFSSHLDETSELADIILPTNHALESWGDVRSVPGVNSLIQPTMAPIFDTRPFGDLLITLSGSAGKEIAAGTSKDFQGYLKESWRKLFGTLGSQPEKDFESFWIASLDRGGYFSSSSNGAKSVPQPNVQALAMSFEAATFETKGAKASDLVFYPFVSVKSFDGRAANRPWMQELADPISQVVWDSWAELHPETAKQKGIASGDMVTIRNFYGEVNVPAYITQGVKPGVVAVPIGQGHQSYGQFARNVGGGNAISLIPPSAEMAGSVAVLRTRVEVVRGRGKSNVVNVQGSDSQLGRELSQSTLVTTVAAHKEGSHNGSSHSESSHGGHDDGHHDEHHVKQMYEQRIHPTYKWGMAVDLSACTGCSACVVACYAENNIPVVGKTRCSEGREMAWLRIERYFDSPAEELKVSFLPMMCQQCGNAPCEPVCPVYATYHNEEGLNAMVYNRCVGTRYCSNNCSYKVRRFNWFEYELPSPLEMQLNPDVVKRSTGVMEKCTFCVQRIAEAKDHAKDLGRMVQDGEVQPACVQSCPTQALTFGDLNDRKSRVSKLSRDKRAYKILDHHINTQPSITYLKNVRHKV